MKILRAVRIGICWQIAQLPIALLVIAGGCDGGHSQLGVPLASSGSLSNTSYSRQILIEKDFGVVSPNAHLSDQIEFSNPTDDTFTIKRLGTSCSCTVASISTKTILPHQIVTLNVEMKPGEDTADVNQKVLVECNEPSAPIWIIRLIAEVRHPISLEQPEMHFDELNGKDHATRQIKIWNFSDVSWRKLTAEANEEWVKVHAHLVSKKDSTSSAGLTPTTPREEWNLEITAIPNGLEPGSHSCKVSIVADGAPANHAYEEHFPVTLTIIEPVRCVPTELFLGEICVSASAKSNVNITFRGDLMPHDPPQIHLSHDLVDALKIDWLRINESTWTLLATFTPKSSGKVNGTIIVNQDQPELGKLTIPVVARVIAKQ